MMWLSRPGLYGPTFRAYAQHLGRFNQTDPIGFGGDGPNLYAYVLNDPVNATDPLGLAVGPEILVTALRAIEGMPTSVTFGDTGKQVPSGFGCGSAQCQIVVTGKRLANRSKSVLNLTLQQQQKQQYCQAVQFTDNLIIAGDVTAGVLAAFGAEPAAGLVEGGVTAFTLGAAGYQWLRGDRAGAVVTLGSSVAGSAVLRGAAWISRSTPITRDILGRVAAVATSETGSGVGRKTQGTCQ
jgi:RHS repeat-associated protein